MTLIKSLGFVKAIHEGDTPPVNQKMIWFHTSAGTHKGYSSATSSWVSLAQASPSAWSVTLAADASSGSNSPIIEQGQVMFFNNATFTASIGSGVLTANRTVTLPNSSGVIALTSDIPSTPNLSTVLTAGRVTDATGIVMKTGSTISAESGIGSMSLRDGLDGLVKVNGATVTMEATASIVGSIGGSSKFVAKSAGVGFGITNPDSAVHISKSSSPATSGAALKIGGGSGYMTVGSTTGKSWIQSNGGFLHINSLDGSDSVLIGQATFTPNSTYGLMVSSSSDTSLCVNKKAASNTSRVVFNHSGTTEEAEMSVDNVQDFNITNKALSKKIVMRINGSTSVFEIDPTVTSGAARFKRGVVVDIDSLENPSSSTITSGSKHLIEYNITTNKNIHAITGGADGRLVYLVNRGNAILSLIDNVAGAGANRIRTPQGADYDIKSMEAALIYYSSSVGGWLIISR